MKCFYFHLFLFFVITFYITPGVKAQPIGYAYSKNITINSAVVTGTNDLINFPFLLKVTDNDLKSVANGGYVNSNNGHDIIFTDASCGTQFSHQIDKYNPLTGELICWIKIPLLSYSVNTMIHIYYGNSTITAATSTTATWNSSYDLVYHFENNPAGAAPQITDGTSAMRQGTCNGSMTSTNSVTGKIGSAITFDESNDYVLTSDFDYTQSFSISFWFNLQEVNGSAYQYFFSHGTFATNNSANIYIGEASVTYTPDQQMLKTVFQDSNDGANTSILDAGSSYANGFWHYYTLVVGNAGGAFVYVDGILKANYNVLGGNSYNPATNIFIGGRSDLDASRFLGGSLDEFRISNEPKSADWISTEYNNQNSPNTYYSVGAQISATIQCELLPIELLSFSAKQIDNIITISWVTESEKNNTDYIIEHAIEGETIQEIARVTSRGNSNLKQAYDYNYDTGKEGNHYFRLKRLEEDGSYSYSQIILLEYKPKVHFDIWPNPSTGNFEIHSNIKYTHIENTIRIFDTNGIILLEREPDTFPLKINSSHLKQGLYYLEYNSLRQKLVILESPY